MLQRVLSPLCARILRAPCHLTACRASVVCTGRRTMFVQKINPLSGQSEWVVTDVTGDKSSTLAEQEALTGLVSNSLYLDMLTDSYRNAAYHAALQQTVRLGDTVLDIGTGTGLLAMLAARVEAKSSPSQDRSPVQVIGCEVFPPMAKLAEHMVAHNGLQFTVRILHKRSDEIVVADSSQEPEADLPGKVDVIVTEIFDSELLGEGLLPTMRHASKQLLKDGGAVIPARARVFGQLVESELLRSCQVTEPPTDPPTALAALFEQIYAADSTGPVSHGSTGPVGGGPGDPKVPRGGGEGAGGVGPSGMRMRELDVDPLYPHALRPLSQPFVMFEFDLARPPEGNQSTQLQAVAIAPGRVDALVLWWQLQMDAAGKLLISTAPSWIPRGDAGSGAPGASLRGISQQWRGHWRHCWAALTQHRLQVAPGDHVELRAHHGDCNIFVDVEGSTRQGPSLLAQQLSAWHSPARTWLLQDAARWRRYSEAVRMAAERLAKDMPQMSGVRVLALGDGMMPAMAAAALPEVVAVTACRGGMDTLGKSLLQEVGRHALFDSKVRTMDIEAVIKVERQRSSTAAATARQGVLLLGEPFYRECESQLPWAHLRFWHEASILHECHALAIANNRSTVRRRFWHEASALREAMAPRPCAVLPCRGRLMAAGVSLPELWRTRRALQRVEGVDLEPANALMGALGGGEGAVALLLPCELWQCGGGIRELTQRRCLLSLDFSGPVVEAEGAAFLTATAPGTCHAVALWMEYDLDQEGGIQVDGPPGELGAPDPRQYAVLLMPDPQQLQAIQEPEPEVDDAAEEDSSEVACGVRVRAVFDATQGDVSFFAEFGYQ